ncbi:MAG: RHS repeat-associated core domain-containing protein [Oscillospiraceae bacterium]|nr:RHS repeat-associated core domain-containing protein [Oscillospiraceae bacterium]
MLSDGTWTYTWEHGRQLATTTDGTTSVSYEYNSDGMRLSKTVGSTKTEYYYVGSQLVEMTQGSNKLHFTYDATGASAVTYNGTNYYYVKNAQGDIIGIVNTSGTVVVSYTYDAWGNVLSVTGSMASTLGALNPLRYRGYVYDTETGLYYLQSRYYDPSIGRFICADAFLSTGQGSFGSNMYAYCENNPVAYNDPSGNLRNYCVTVTDSGTQINMVTKRKITKDNQPASKTEEQLVLDAKHPTTYKGAPVLRVPFMKDYGFSFGIILLGPDVNSENTLRHEYGHVAHLKLIGPIRYFFFVAIPSITVFTIQGVDPPERYYSYPWECIADILGGVKNEYDYYPGAVLRAFKYLDFTISLEWDSE